MADDFYARGQFLVSAIHFSLASTELGLGSNEYIRARLGAAFSYYELGEKNEALAQLQHLQAVVPELRPRLQVIRAFNEPPPVSLLLPEDARLRFRVWENRGRGVAALQGVGAFENKPAVTASLKTLGESRVKNPWVAGGLSALLPGAGQAYAGLYQSAAVALILNALFLATTIELAKRDLWFSAAASGLVFSVTYAGNIFSAAQGARLQNDREAAPVEKVLRLQLFPEIRFP